MKQRRIGRLIIIALILFLVGFSAGVSIFSYSRVKELIAELKVTQDKSKDVVQAFKTLDFPQAKSKLEILKTELEKSKAIYTKLSYLKFVPFINSYYLDGQAVIESGEELIVTGEVISDNLAKELEKLNFKAGSATIQTFTPTLLKVMPSLTETLPEVEKRVKTAHEKMSRVKPQRYPKKISKWEVRSNLESFQKTLNLFYQTLPKFKEILQIVPSVLGSDRSKTYLLLFQNDKELRSTGGFITSYAIAVVQNGKLVSIKSDDIYNVDDEIRNKKPAPDFIKKYLKVNKLHLRDSNFSPDFTEFVKEFASIYDQYSPSQAIDGMIALDTEFLLGMIDFLGPIKTKQYKEVFTNEINEEYGFPDALYKLELYSENLLSQKENRKELIGDLMNSMLEAFFKQPITRWPDFFETLAKLADQKHILANFRNEGTQALLESYNFAGRVRDFDGDYFYLVENNYSSKKANLYTTEKIDQDLKIDQDGSLIKVVTVTLTNLKPNDSWLNSNYLDYMRFYLPKGTELKNSQDLEDVKTFEDLGKTVISGSVLVPTQNTKSVSISYKLPFKIDKNQEYKLLVQKQPGTKDVELNLFINGKKLKVKDLIVEKEGKKLNRLQKDTEIKFFP